MTLVLFDLPRVRSRLTWQASRLQLHTIRAKVAMLVHKGFFDERDRGALDDVVEVKKHRRLLTFFLDH